jgi:hypothetical protein
MQEKASHVHKKERKQSAHQLATHILIIKLHKQTCEFLCFEELFYFKARMHM